MRYGYGLGLVDRPRPAAPIFDPLALSPAAWYKADAGAYVNAGSTLATDGQTVQQLNDAGAGSWNLSQATAGSRPTYNAPVLGDIGGLTFASKIIENTGVDFVNGATALDIFIIMEQSNGDTACFLTAGVSGSTSLEMFIGSTGDWFNERVNRGTFGIPSGTSCPRGWLHQMTYDGSQATNALKLIHRVNNVLMTPSYVGTIPAALPAANGLRVGNDFLSLPWPGKLSELIIFPSVLSAPDRALMVTYCRTRQAQGTRSYVTCVGDSLTEGTGAQPSSYPTQLAASLGTGWKVTNMGVSGTSAVASWVGGEAFMNSLLYPATGHPKDIEVLHLGHNDLNSGQTGAQVMANLTTYCAARRAAASGVKIIGCTVWPSAALTAGEETERGTLNAAILAASGTVFDAVADTGALANLQNTGNATYFQVDGVHPKAAAYADVAAAIQTEVLAL